MASQKIFTTEYIDEMVNNIRDENVKKYSNEVFDVNENSTEITGISIEENPTLIIPKKEDRGDNIENVKIIFDTYKNITRAQSTEVRFWAYLTHVVFWNYMKARTNPDSITNDKKGAEYILRHWFIQGGLERNDIARMWWGAKLTYDEKRKNPYELTKIFFSMQDFTRTIFKSHFGKYKKFLHAFLEYVMEEEDLFSNKKEAKARLLAKKMNALGAFKNIAILDKEEIKDLFDRYKSDLEKLDTKEI